MAAMTFTSLLYDAQLIVLSGGHGNASNRATCCGACAVQSGTILTSCTQSVKSTQLYDIALQGGSGPSASARRIYVGGIPFETREAELREFFEAVMQKGRGCKLLFWLSLLAFWAN